MRIMDTFRSHSSLTKYGQTWVFCRRFWWIWTTRSSESHAKSMALEQGSSSLTKILEPLNTLFDWVSQSLIVFIFHEVHGLLNYYGPGPSWHISSRRGAKAHSWDEPKQHPCVSIYSLKFGSPLQSRKGATYIGSKLGFLRNKKNGPKQAQIRPLDLGLKQSSKINKLFNIDNCLFLLRGLY